MAYSIVDVAQVTVIENVVTLPAEIAGLDDASIADLSWVGEPLASIYAGKGYWPIENNDQAYDPASEVLDDTTLTFTPVKSRQVVKTRRTKRAMTSDELLAYQRAVNPVPAAISDRQFAQILAIDGLISQDEALAWVSTGTIPTQLAAVVDAIPDEAQRFTAKMLLGGATTFERAHPMTESLAAGLGMTAQQVDDLWRSGALL